MQLSRRWKKEENFREKEAQRLQRNQARKGKTKKKKNQRENAELEARKWSG